MIDEVRLVKQFNNVSHRIMRLTVVIFSKIVQGKEVSSEMALFEEKRGKAVSILDKIWEEHLDDSMGNAFRAYEGFCNEFEAAVAAKNVEKVNEWGHKIVAQGIKIIDSLKLRFNVILPAQKTVEDLQKELR